jgi:hypothetical protein
VPKSHFTSQGIAALVTSGAADPNQTEALIADTVTLLTPIAKGIASSQHLDTIALRGCDHWDVRLGRVGCRIAPGIQRCHARIDVGAVSPDRLSGLCRETWSPLREREASRAVFARRVSPG